MIATGKYTQTSKTGALGAYPKGIAAPIHVKRCIGKRKALLFLKRLPEKIKGRICGL